MTSPYEQIVEALEIGLKNLYPTPDKENTDWAKFNKALQLLRAHKDKVQEVVESSKVLDLAIIQEKALIGEAHLDFFGGADE